MTLCEWCLETEGFGTLINHDNTWSCWVCQNCAEEIEGERHIAARIEYENEKFYNKSKPCKMIGEDVYYYDELTSKYILFKPLVVTNEKAYVLKEKIFFLE